MYKWVLVLSVLFCASTAHSQPVLFGASSGTGSLYRINTSNGTGTLVGALKDASNHAFGIRSLAGDSTGQLWGTTSDDSPTSPDSLVRINAGSAVVTVVGPLNAPSGGGANDIAFMANGTLIGWFPGASVYGTINTTTGQVTALSAPQATQTGGVAVAQSLVLLGPFTFPAGTVVSITSTSQAPNATTRTFSTVTNTDTAAWPVTAAPCCTFTALEISSTGTVYALAAGSLVSIPLSGVANTLGAVPAGVVALAFATAPTVTISVSPTSVSLFALQTQTFTATIGNTANTAATFSIPVGAPGTINASTGLYTAPGSITTQQTVTVTATSQADPTQTATATVTLTPGISSAPVPPTFWLAALGLGFALLAKKRTYFAAR